MFYFSRTIGEVRRWDALTFLNVNIYIREKLEGVILDNSNRDKEIILFKGTPINDNSSTSWRPIFDDIDILGFSIIKDIPNVETILNAQIAVAMKNVKID